LIDQKEIHNQCSSDNPTERIKGLKHLEYDFFLLPDKQQAWNDLIKLTFDKNNFVRAKAADAIVFSYSYVPDKQRAWNDLIELINNEDSWVRSSAAFALNSAIFYLLDKQQAWNDLHKLTGHRDSKVRLNAVSVLGSAFSYIPDKNVASKDLHRLTNDMYSDVRSSAASALGVAFPNLPDKLQAFDELHKLITDKDSDVRSNAASALGSAFSHIPHKQQAWNDLVKLTDDESENVRQKVAENLDFAFSQLPDKQQAWNSLHKLTTHENSSVRYGAGSAVGSAYSHLPDKQRAFKDLIKLTSDKDYRVRSKAASSLGSTYSQLPDKQRALKNLIKLTNDRNRTVRAYATHSLGRISIFNASQAEKDEDYKKELEKAITFFEAAAVESNYEWFNPSQFCLPFYRSFYSIIFKKKNSKKEIYKYLAEAHSAIKGSKSKELLLEAVENLANALKDIQNLKNPDLNAVKGELNFYRRYCDRAAELMIDTEEAAPFATITMRKGLPILDRKLKEIIEEIQEKANISCRESRGTDSEGIICEINKEIQNTISDDQRQYIEILEDVVSILKMKIPPIPENRFIFSKIELIENKRISPEKYRDLPLIISIMNTMKVVSEQELDKKLDQKFKNFDLIFGEIIYIKDKLGCISFDISKIKLNSANVISNLKTIKEELEKLSKIEGLNTFAIEKLDSTQTEKLNSLKNTILECFDEIKILIGDLPKNNDTKEILEILNKLKQSDLDILLQRSSGIATLISFFAMFV
jgi:HEAT repeat protein